MLAGAGTFAVHILFRSVLSAGPDPTVFALDSLWMPVSALGVIGAVLVLMGLPAAFVRIVGAAGLSGVAGLALLAVAWMFFGLFFSLYSLLVLPWLAEQAPSLVAARAPLPAPMIGAFLIGLLAWFVGALLLATPFIRGLARPTWLGYVVVGSAVWMLVGNALLAPSGPVSDLGLNLLSNMSPVILLVGLAYLARPEIGVRNRQTHSPTASESETESWPSRSSG